MSARAATRTMRTCAQSIRMASRQFNHVAHNVNMVPEMRLKPMKMPNMEMLNKNMNKFVRYAKLQRLQTAALTVMMTSSANIALVLADLLSSTLSSDDDEEGSSSGVRRRKGQ